MRGNISVKMMERKRDRVRDIEATSKIKSFEFLFLIQKGEGIYVRINEKSKF